MPLSTQREVTFPGTNGVRLAGTLQIPAGRGQVPALVLLAGSGPTDRDGNQLPGLRTDLLAQVARILADAGVASLRYDKRGIGKSEPLPLTDEALLSAFASWENFVGDAASGLRWLRKQPGILTTRTGLFGHSEGGLIALQAAVDTAPSALILASTPGRPLGAVLHDQIARLLTIQKATPKQTDFYLNKLDSITTTLLRTGKAPDDVPPGLAALFPAYLGRFWQSVLNLDPARLAARFPGPVLVLQGARDTQCLADKDAPALDAALRSRRPDDHTLALIPNAGHSLKPTRDPASPTSEGPIAPEAAKAIRDWSTTKLPTPSGVDSP